MNIGDWPDDLLPYRWEFYLQPNSRSFLSPVTRTRQVRVGQGPRWVGTGSWKFDSRRKEQRFEAWLDKMQGQANTVNVWDFAHKNGRPLGPLLDLSSIGVTRFTDLTGFTDGTYFTGSVAGVTIFGGWAVGSEIAKVTGFPQHTTQLYAGDHVQLGDYLYRLTEDATADGMNRATLYLNRPLIQAVTHGTALTTTKPCTPMQLLDDDQTRRAVGVGAVRQYVVSFVEALI